MSKILIAPLDWGLGHATRCIPIIQELVALGCHVSIAASGHTEALLRREFPYLRFLPLQGYDIHYGKTVLLSLLRQGPRILRTIKVENKWLKELLKQEKFDAIISDNRPGLYHASVPCVYITHQLQILSGMGGIANRILFLLHKKYQLRFQKVWVPDYDMPPGLAGKLSHPAFDSGTVQYIGPLSRFQPQNEAAKKWDLLFLISGPEPQRSRFEQQLLHQFQNTKETILLVRGLPDNSTLPEKIPQQVEVKNHLPAGELASALAAASYVICRSGYTTVMDLTLLGKKALLVPTPGQTEQEYLARHLEESGYFPSLKQSEFHPEKAIDKIRKFTYRPSESPQQYQQFKKIIYNWLTLINEPKK